MRLVKAWIYEKKRKSKVIYKKSTRGRLQFLCARDIMIMI